MKIFAVRIGNKYGPEYEKYLEEKLPEYEFHWIRQAFEPGVMLQWNKMMPMGFDIDEPVVVMDIDVLLINDYKEIFEYPVKKGEFLGMPDWWNSYHLERGYSINGGFFKYYPKDCRYIYDEFVKNKNHWQKHYIKNGTTKGPVNGEQYFVEDQVKKNLELKHLPEAWFTRWATPKAVEMGNLWKDEDLQTTYNQWEVWMNCRYKERTGNDFLYLGGEFHDDIKMIHFTHAVNKPHEWEDYRDFI